MNSGLLAVLVVAAVLLFWVIGAYNRLMAMRNGIADILDARALVLN